MNKGGYRVPEDIRVTGFDGIEEGRTNYPSIATCEPRFDTVADFVFDVLEGTNDSDEFMVPLRFHPKESCGCSDVENVDDKTEISRLMENARVSSWQNGMLNTMQFELIDSIELESMLGYMYSPLDLFKGYDHLFCIRDDIEHISDYTIPFDMMRSFFNKGMIPDKACGSFSIKEVTPDYESVFEACKPDEMIICRLLHNGHKIYGYHIVRTSEYVSSDLKLFSQFTESVTLVIESILRNKRLNRANKQLSEMYERLSEIYIKDTLTGLYNRHGYYKNIEEYVKRSEIRDGYVHLISIDMDGMKLINDNYGHLEGDNAIKAVATAIKDCFAHPCISARFGGDEFLVALFTNSEEQPTTDKISEKLNGYLAEMPMLKDKEYKVEVSVGQAVAKVQEFNDYKVIEKCADDSMYVEKRKRKEHKQ